MMLLHMLLHLMHCSCAPCKDCPVKLVVFDFDETLTLATFMTGNCEYADDEARTQLEWAIWCLEDAAACCGAPL